MPTATSTAELASTMRLAVMRLARRLRSERGEHGLTLTQLATLSTLDNHGPLSPRELADHEHVQPPSMTRILAHLEEKALVRRAPHPTDGRQQLVTRTGSAAELLQGDRRRREAWLAVRLAELTPEERCTLRAAAGIMQRLTSS